MAKDTRLFGMRLIEWVSSHTIMPKALDHFVGTALGQVQKLGWFGFAADPPTLAHRSVVDAVLGSGRVEKMIVFPAGKLPYKDFFSSDWQRAEMTELWYSAAGFGDEVIISRFDMNRPQAMTWIDLWKTINQLAPNIEHSLIVGSEPYRDIAATWNEGEELLEKARFIVVPREGQEVKTTHPHHHILPLATLVGASTSARNGNLALVDEKVRGYIEEEELYSDIASS